MCYKRRDKETKILTTHTFFYEKAYCATNKTSATTCNELKNVL